MDFEFKTFSPRSFERFAQALAAHVLGPGLMIFGDGPDGGREAAYEGQLDFPNKAEQWSGYTILQAKFLQTPKDPADDANWLGAQLQADLDKFVAIGSKLRRPDYYILVSNAKLSPQPETSRGKGGIAKIDQIFSKYQKRLKLKGYRVWHLDQLSTYLLNADGLRRSYSAWLSSSDVISDILREISNKDEKLTEAMYRYLARELRNHQPIRLQQAGHSGDAVTMIEDVFCDLPFRSLSTNPTDTEDLLLSKLLSRAQDCLDRASVKAQPQNKDGRPERILLLGGPGQGKSTISQFFSQVFRANLLFNNKPELVPIEVHNISLRTLDKVANLSPRSSIPKRFPFRVDLPGFADYLANAQENKRSGTVLNYISQEISRIADAEVSVENVRSWIKHYPAVLILDGLDEVPPSANRSDVILAISELWDDAASSDLLMIVTTRPQGYNDDLDPKLYTKYELTELNVDQAISYAETLAESRLADTIQRDRVMSRLREAARSPSTSRLMVSPLQVAILLALIDQRGDAPSDRWTLFDKYFSVVLEREQGKSGHVGETMRHWSRQITGLHYKAGFLLHVDAETDGNSESYLTRNDLHLLIRGQLADDEYEGQDLDESSSALLAASTERLVLLVQREEGRFSFEVRSLQEFMAAAHLMTGREAMIQRRLQEIANKDHWLHVFQIAASKCFSVNDTEHLRDTIVTICRSLNENGDGLDRFLRLGSHLALKLLDDGLAYDQPKYRRLLLTIALDMTAIGPEYLVPSLATHCGNEARRAEEIVRTFIASKANAPKLATFQLLFHCVRLGQEWAENLLKSVIRSRECDPATTVVLSAAVHSNDTIEKIGRDALAEATYAEILSASGRKDIPVLAERFPCLEMLVSHREDTSANLNFEEPLPLSFPFVSINISNAKKRVYGDVPKSIKWMPIHSVLEFHRDPRASTLASLIREIDENHWLEEYKAIYHSLPWPLMTILRLAFGGQALCGMADAAAQGKFGDNESWIAAEGRFQASGITEADLQLWQSGTFFDDRIANLGGPWLQISLSHGKYDLKWVDVLMDYASKAQGAPRSYLRNILVFVMSVYPTSKPLTLAQAQFLLGPSQEPTLVDRMEVDVLQNIPEEFFDETDFLAILDVRGSNNGVYLGGRVKKSLKTIFQKMTGDLTKYPGLLMLFGAILSTKPEDLDLSVLTEEILYPLCGHPNPTLAGYARVLKVVSMRYDASDIDYIFQCSGGSMFPSSLLRMLLDKEPSLFDDKYELANLIAERSNIEISDFRDDFVPSLRMISAKRLTNFKDAETWSKLSFGETLFTQIGRRAKVN